MVSNPGSQARPEKTSIDWIKVHFLTRSPFRVDADHNSPQTSLRIISAGEVDRSQYACNRGMDGLQQCFVSGKVPVKNKGYNGRFAPLADCFPSESAY
jgi:hypothetical protein